MQNKTFSIAVLGAGNIGSAVLTRLKELDDNILNLELKRVLVNFTITSDHSSSGTYDDTYFTIAGNSTPASSLITVAGELSATTLDIGGTNITADAAEINKMDGVTATSTELNYTDITTLGTSEASKAVTVDSNGDLIIPDSDKYQFGTGSD